MFFPYFLLLFFIHFLYDFSQIFYMTFVYLQIFENTIHSLYKVMQTIALFL